MKRPDIESIELDLLIEGIARRYGYDFRHYARGSLHRRVRYAMTTCGANRLSTFQGELLHEPELFDRFLECMSVTVTRMFRDPEFFLALREKIIPVLKTYPFINVWHAGCATGEEAYSMAIVLSEEGVGDRARIYATDYNASSIKAAKRGVYSARAIRECAPDYHRGGGTSSLSDYYDAGYNDVKFSESLKRMITFARHNLVGDGVFGEMQLIVCRNVLIYFDTELQADVLSLLHDSLCSHGFLALGSKESVRAAKQSIEFAKIDDSLPIYRCAKAGAQLHSKLSSDRQAV